MIRSSSMLVTRARSVRNICKVPFKFRFELHADTADQVVGTGEVVLVWVRPSKPLSTSPAQLDTTNRRARFSGPHLSTEVTLFKSAVTDRRFHDKVIKLALRATSIDGKTLGKVHLNLADYAEVPSACRRFSAEMDSGATLLATVHCTFLSTGKAASSLRGPSPVQHEYSLAMYSDDEATECSSEFGNVTAGGGSSSTSANTNLLGWGRLRMRRSNSRPTLRRGDDGVDAVDLAEQLARARRENVILRAQVEEMERDRNSEALKENRDLLRQLDELKIANAREPVYADVVKELQETKMQIAVVMLEKEKIAVGLAKHQN